MNRKTGYILREANQNDLDALYQLELATFAEDRFTEDQIEYQLIKSRATNFVVEKDSVIVGAACLLWRKLNWSARLYNLAVHPKYQGQGIGLILLNECEKEAARRGCKKITLEVRSDNKGGIKFYENKGFVGSKMLPSYYDDGTDGIKMEKEIDIKVPSSIKLNIPYYAQTLDFTCGPSSLLMALHYFYPEIEMTPALEYSLWKEATLVFMASGYGGTDGYGLALAAHNRGLTGQIVTSFDRAPMLRSVRSRKKQEVMKIVHDDMKKEVIRTGFGSATYQYGIDEIISGLHRNMVPLVMISTYRLTGDKVPHWVVVTGFDDKHVFIHDTDSESYKRNLSKAKNLKIEKSEFLRMSRYGKEVYRCLLLLGKESAK